MIFDVRLENGRHHRLLNMKPTRNNNEEAASEVTMHKLLEHLKAHEATADPWILVYDNRGTFSRKVGDAIRICNLATGASQLLGIPVRTATYVDYRGAVVLETRVERAELPELIRRIECHVSLLRRISSIQENNHAAIRS